MYWLYLFIALVVGYILHGIVIGTINWWEEEKKRISSDAYWSTMRKLDDEKQSWHYAYGIMKALEEYNKKHPERVKEFLKNIGVIE